MAHAQELKKIKDEIMSKIYLYRDKEWLLNNYVNKMKNTRERLC